MRAPRGRSQRCWPTLAGPMSSTSAVLRVRASSRRSASPGSRLVADEARGTTDSGCSLADATDQNRGLMTAEPGRLRFRTVATGGARLSLMEAGTGPPALALHGLGGTKGSFLPTVAALAGGFRVMAVDLPGFGDSDKPIGAAYDARFFASAVIDLLDALELDRVHLIGNSLGGRIALEIALRRP